ncbi:hypothetical protein [Pontibacillus sp. HN14]|nr:hypothetical protein [Pontibacillus sp. HN14]
MKPGDYVLIINKYNYAIRQITSNYNYDHETERHYREIKSVSEELPSVTPLEGNLKQLPKAIQAKLGRRTTTKLTYYHQTLFNLP